jgi:predicted RNase H-like HicB family nuclease
MSWASDNPATNESTKQAFQFFAYAYGTNPTCPNYNNGKADVLVFGAVPPVTYQWSNGATTDSLRNLTQGTYTVTITDAIGYSIVETIQLINIAGLYPSLEILKQPSCPNFNNGEVRVYDVYGGTAPFTYLWSTGATTNTVNNLSSGLYSLTVTDANGCAGQTDFDLIDGTGYVSVSALQNPTCPNFNNGKLEADFFYNLSPPFTYLWSNGKTTQSISNLIEGFYTVTVTDVNGCTGSQDANLYNTNLYSYMSDVQVPTCPNYNNGQLSVDVYGGAAPFTYLWSNGTTTATATNLTEGNYSVTVTDVNGCSSVIAQHLFKSYPYVYVQTTQPPTCPNFNNGKVDFVGFVGGVAPYSFVWSNGSTTSGITNASQGFYTLSVTDANGCSASQTAFVNNATLDIYAGLVQNPSCPNFNNGQATIYYIANGVAPYSYLWSNGATTLTVSNLTQGIYSVTVTDANGCSASAALQLDNQVNTVYADIINQPTCPNFNNGAVTVSYATGTAPFSYLWSNGATTQSISNLQQGTYSVTVTDVNGCKGSSSVQIINAVDYAYVYTVQEPSCPNFNNGIATIQPPTGVAPFTYLWSNGATTDTIKNLTTGLYVLTVTDANGCSAVGSTYLYGTTSFFAYTAINQNVGCNTTGEAEVKYIFGGTAPYSYLWSNGATTSVASNLSAGIYTVTITDASGCTSQSSVFLFNSGLVLFATVTQQPTCPNFDNGIAEVKNVFHGTAPYTYLWSNGATTASASNLSNGVYTVTVTDKLGCSAESSLYVFGSVPIVLAVPTQMPTCPNFNNGEAEVLYVVNAIPPYQYQWSNGATTANISNLSAGTYTFTFTDANGCNAIDSVTLSNAGLYPVIASSDPTCPSNNDGSVSVLYTLGGTAPYTYLWSNGATTTNLNNLGLGDYFVTVTDATGCTGVGAISLFNTSIWAYTYPIQQPTCSNSNDGSAGVYPIGHAPFTYIWSNGATTDTIGGLTPGTYFVTVTDFKGCSFVDSITLNSMNSSGSATFNFIVQGNTVHFHSSSAYAMYMTWAFGDGNTMNNLHHTPSHTYSQSGSYNVTLTCQDSCGNTTSRTVTIDVGNFVELDAKVYLEGAYNTTTGTMDDYLRISGLLPTSEPFSTIFNHVSNANEVTTKAILNNNTFPTVVDWIFVELRAATNPANILATRAGLLLQNGKIVDMDGTSPLRFAATQANNYYIAVRHRNHLGFRTLNTIALSQNAVSLDFTTNAIQLNGPSPMNTSISTARMMYSGDANSDGSIDAFDSIIWENQNGTFDNYDKVDYNLDGSIDAFDSIIWEINNGKFEEID